MALLKRAMSLIWLINTVEPNQFSVALKALRLSQAFLNIVNIPGIIWISAILAIVFGYLAKDNSATGQFSASMSDIAKVFAG